MKDDQHHVEGIHIHCTLMLSAFLKCCPQRKHRHTHSLKDKAICQCKKYKQVPSDIHLQSVNEGTKTRAVVLYSATNVSKGWTSSTSNLKKTEERWCVLFNLCCRIQKQIKFYQSSQARVHRCDTFCNTILSGTQVL